MLQAYDKSPHWLSLVLLQAFGLSAINDSNFTYLVHGAKYMAIYPDLWNFEGKIIYQKAHTEFPGFKIPLVVI